MLHVPRHKKTMFTAIFYRFRFLLDTEHKMNTPVVEYFIGYSFPSSNIYIYKVK